MKIEFKNNQNESIFFLSKVVKTKVFLNGRKIGKLLDLIILEREKVAEVTHAVVSRPFGYPSLMVPWDKVSSFDEKSITLDYLGNIEKFACKIPEGVILLKDYILDKKIQDVEGTDIKVVYDIKIVMRMNKLYITDVDPSENALYRRLGLERFANLVQKKNDNRRNMLIPWSYVQALPLNIGSFTGDVKLKVLKDKLNYLPPVDIKDIFEELDQKHRLPVVNHLEENHAFGVLEEISPNSQREIVFSLNKEKVAV
jgi:sporulation protein YlmC with PRC-barrel domain